jgi:hypothetical protein
MSIDNHGTIKVPEDIELTNASDCAEEFDVSSTEIAEPGTVIVLNEARSLYMQSSRSPQSSEYSLWWRRHEVTKVSIGTGGSGGSPAGPFGCSTSSIGGSGAGGCGSHAFSGGGGGSSVEKGGAS